MPAPRLAKPPEVCHVVPLIENSYAPEPPVAVAVIEPFVLLKQPVTFTAVTEPVSCVGSVNCVPAVPSRSITHEVLAASRILT